MIRWENSSLGLVGVFDLRGAKSQTGEIDSDWFPLVGAWEWRAEDGVLLLALAPSGDWPGEEGMDIWTEAMRGELEYWRGHLRLRDALLNVPDRVKRRSRKSV